MLGLMGPFGNLSFLLLYMLIFQVMSDRHLSFAIFFWAGEKSNVVKHPIDLPDGLKGFLIIIINFNDFYNLNSKSFFRYQVHFF